MRKVDTPMTQTEVEMTRLGLKHFLGCEPESIMSDLVDRLCNTAVSKVSKPANVAVSIPMS